MAAAERTFPYSSLDDAIKDQFRKCGVGPTWKSYAIQLLRTGFYQLMARKDRNARIAADAEYGRLVRSKVLSDGELAAVVNAKLGAKH